MTVFAQKEGSIHVHAVDQLDGLTLVTLKELVLGKDEGLAEILVFEEGCDEPLTEEIFIVLLKEKRHPKVHIHRCRKVETRVFFNAREVTHHFSPATTLATVKAWADSKFEIDPSHAAEHVLQLQSTVERPSPSTHLGSLTHGQLCAVMFDLVPNERIQG
jgi:hypothetical protein